MAKSDLPSEDLRKVAALLLAAIDPMQQVSLKKRARGIYAEMAKPGYWAFAKPAASRSTRPLNQKKS